MGLKKYWTKRDFEETPEPRGVPPKKRAVGDRRKGARSSFVIQKHAASRLHYDFRLELDGVLKSWAVPKGPSLDPREKRLAVRVEDHPLEYGGFEGIIPAGQYGGGTVLLWDRGKWTPKDDAGEGLRRGHLSFELDGKKLHGAWSLVRMPPRDGRRGARGTPGDGHDGGERENWLLIKADDDSARKRGDVTVASPESVKTGRSIDDIAKRARSTWQSDRPTTGAGAKTARSGAAPSTKSKSKPKPKRSVAAKRTSVDPQSGARHAKLPATLGFQLATLVAESPSGDEWLQEIKFDGYRIGCRVEDGKARLFSRNNLDWTGRFSAIAEEAASLPVRAAWLDGEVVVLDDRGISSFQALQQSIKGERGEGLVYYVFDLLHLDGWDLRDVALEQRKSLLEPLIGGRSGKRTRIRYSDHVEGGGPDFHALACKRGLEGVIAKRRDRAYSAKRGRDWLKIKCVRDQELVIGGWSEPEGARTGLGALLLGVYEGGTLRFAGKVGTGFTEKTLRSLRARLDPLERPTPPFSNPPKGAAARGVHWVAPKLVAQVRFLEWTSEGSLRHPSFEGLREDKDPREVVRERAKAATRPRRTKKAKDR